MGISERGLRVAMMDTVLQQDRAREAALIAKLREKLAEVTRIHREIKRLNGDLIVVQRQMAAIADALALEGVRV
jgi:hypothetical protein